jgi:hypothetical protein
MPTTDANQEAARAYAEGVRAFFAPSAALPTAERGERRVALPEDLAERAERLAPLSTNLTQEIAARLASPNPAAREQASTSLLAKALTDLDISGHLLQAALDEESQATQGLGIPPTLTEAIRSGSAAALDAIEEQLQFILGEAETSPLAIQRASTEATPNELSQQAEDALALILQRASRVGQAALNGLVGMGIADVARAAGVVGLNMAQALGHVEKVTRLYNLFRDFALKAYDAILALIGPHIVQTAAKEVLDWLDKMRGGERFGQLLEKLYETRTTGQGLRQRVLQSGATPARCGLALQAVDALKQSYQRQVDLADKLLGGLRWVGLVPGAALPQGQVLLGAAYIALGGYVILAGADYVDSPRLTLLDRVLGIPTVVEQKLSS